MLLGSLVENTLLRKLLTAKNNRARGLWLLLDRAMGKTNLFIYVITIAQIRRW